MPTFEYQTAMAIAALGAALCKQANLDGEQLRMDFLDILEGLGQSPSGVGDVGKTVAGLMDSMMRQGRGKAAG